jgi:hypothetical protein
MRKRPSQQAYAYMNENFYASRITQRKITKSRNESSESISLHGFRLSDAIRSDITNQSEEKHVNEIVEEQKEKRHIHIERMEENYETSNRIQTPQKNIIGMAKDRMERSTENVNIPYTNKRGKRRRKTGHGGFLINFSSQKLTIHKHISIHHKLQSKEWKVEL